MCLYCLDTVTMCLYLFRYSDYVFIYESSFSETAGLSSRYTESSLKAVIMDIHFLSLTDHLVCTLSSQVTQVSHVHPPHIKCTPTTHHMYIHFLSLTDHLVCTLSSQVTPHMYTHLTSHVHPPHITCTYTSCHSQTTWSAHSHHRPPGESVG